MTKKHFTAIAKILNTTTQRANIARSLADYFETENPNFDRERFLTACGI
jgi:hypothetical protein